MSKKTEELAIDDLTGIHEITPDLDFDVLTNAFGPEEVDDEG